MALAVSPEEKTQRPEERYQRWRQGKPWWMGRWTGALVGISLLIVTQLIQPLTQLFLQPIAQLNYPDRGVLVDQSNTVTGLVIYFAIPLIAGSITGVAETTNVWKKGFYTGVILGSLNILISVIELGLIFGESSSFDQVVLQAIAFRTDVQAQFTLFILILTFLWGLLSAFASKATTWGLK